MGKFWLAVLTVVCIASTANGGERPFAEEWEIYRGFLIEPACGQSSDKAKCEVALDRWRRDFRWATDTSFHNQLIGQRNIALCLASSCDGVKPNQLLACAWAEVILNSGDPKISGEDVAFKQDTCASLSVGERKVASAQATRLLNMLTGSIQTAR
ncbi:hypothetical protein [Rhizobium sp. BK377]|uniref:hypothetical protein n=1 Tax=Rhizobium sp. BK377 TaxID=2587058 RepID=UPI0016169DC9|nr:hypothetical protein [Rhizobium sp. BK377]MBB3461987.1 hypothetical protein [Rhizobium sp. BK377]